MIQNSKNQYRGSDIEDNLKFAFKRNFRTKMHVYCVITVNSFGHITRALCYDESLG